MPTDDRAADRDRVKERLDVLDPDPDEPGVDLAGPETRLANAVAEGFDAEQERGDACCCDSHSPLSGSEPWSQSGLTATSALTVHITYLRARPGNRADG